MEKCNCENTGCPHGEGRCPNDAGQVSALFVGKICDECIHHFPLEYLVQDDGLNSWLRRNYLSNITRG